MSKIRIPISNVEQMLKGYARLREAYSRFCVHPTWVITRR